MAYVSRDELAARLGIDSLVLAKLLDQRIITEGKRDRAHEEESVKFRRTLYFAPKDVERAEQAIQTIKWLAVVIPDSWSRLNAEGLTYTLLSQRYHRFGEVMMNGQQMIFYVTGSSAFCGLARVTGKSIKRTTVWPNGVYPYRIPLKPEIVYERTEGVKAKSLLNKLEFISNKKSWEQYFRTTVRLINDKDFMTIERALRKGATDVAIPEQRSRAGAGHGN